MFRKINKMVPVDKQLHFLTGYFGGSLFGLVHPWGALVFLAAIGVLKEVWYDKRYGGTVDKWDAVATALGGLCGVLLCVLR